MKTKRFQWLSDLRKLVRNNLCWWLRRKNRRRHEYNSYCDTEPLSEYSFSSFRDSVNLKSKIPVTDLSSSSYQDCSSSEYASSDIIDNIEDESDLIILTKKNTTQLPFPGVRRITNTLPVIPLPFINSVARIREGNVIEFQMKLPETISYEDLIFNTLSSTIFTASWGSYPFLLDNMRVVPYPGNPVFSIVKESFNRQDKVVFNEYPISSYADSDLGAGESISFSLQGLINAIENKLVNVQKEFSYNSTGRDLEVLDIKIKTELTEGDTEAVDNSFPKTTLEEGSSILPSTIRYDNMLSSAVESRISASSHGDCAFIAKETPFDPFLESSKVFSARQMINQQEKRLAGNLYTTQREGNNLDFNTAIDISLQQFVDAKDIPNSKIFSEVMETRLQHFTSSIIKVQTKTILAEEAKEGTKEDVLIPKRSLQRHIPDVISSEWLPTMEGFDIMWSQTDCKIEKLSFTAALEDGRHKTLLRGSYGHVRLVAAVYKDVMKQVNTDCLATIKSPYLAQLFGVFHGMDQRWVVYHEANYGDLDTFLQLDIQSVTTGTDVKNVICIALSTDTDIDNVFVVALYTDTDIDNVFVVALYTDTDIDNVFVVTLYTDTDIDNVFVVALYTDTDIDNVFVVALYTDTDIDNVFVVALSTDTDIDNVFVVALYTDTDIDNVFVVALYTDTDIDNVFVVALYTDTDIDNVFVVALYTDTDIDNVFVVALSTDTDIDNVFVVALYTDTDIDNVFVVALSTDTDIDNVFVVALYTDTDIDNVFVVALYTDTDIDNVFVVALSTDTDIDNVFVVALYTDTDIDNVFLIALYTDTDIDVFFICIVTEIGIKNVFFITIYTDTYIDVFFTCIAT
ncbi:hypothetical protein ACJMK2_002217 [Sinanodonta woodiana]|uniref:Uncharacterized protein n=1 Tax=Sinanodonta woodiana TaxID=1069815 RepID=A0ABD3XXR2_SINWO